jgi:hypothetical protein
MVHLLVRLIVVPGRLLLEEGLQSRCRDGPVLLARVVLLRLLHGLHVWQKLLLHVLRLLRRLRMLRLQIVCL